MDFLWIVLNIAYNIITGLLYLLPFGIFDNIGSFFPAIYSNGVLITLMLFISIIFWYVFFVYFAGILLMPVDDDIKKDADKNETEYKRTFLGQTVRFFLWSKNVITYSGIFMKYFATLWIRIIPMIFIIAFLYFPFMPDTKGFYTVGQYSVANTEIVKQTIVDMMTGDFSGKWTEELVDSQYGTKPLTPGSMRDPAERKKYEIASYQNNINIRHAASKEMAKYAHISNIEEYNAAIDGYINANMSLLMQDSSSNPEIEESKQIVYAVLNGMDRQLYDYKQRAAGKQSVTLFWGKVIYTGLNLEQFWFAFSLLNGIMWMLFIVMILLLSGWKNIVLLYLHVANTFFAKLERWQDKDIMRKFKATNDKLMEIWPDIREWNYVVENSQSKELYIVLVVEVLVRMLIVYYIFFF